MSEIARGQALDGLYVLEMAFDFKDNIPPGSTLEMAWCHVRSYIEQAQHEDEDVACCGQYEIEYSSDGLASHEICCGKYDRG